MALDPLRGHGIVCRLGAGWRPGSLATSFIVRSNDNAVSQSSCHHASVKGFARPVSWRLRALVAGI